MTHKEIEKYRLPDKPGVYIFRGPSRKILYIGKATSLRNRVRSYFSPNLGDARSSAIAAMIGEAKSVSWRKTDSVLEALILEANLIKQHQPQYNSREKDDKSYNYLVVTKEDFPRVLVIRGRELFGIQVPTLRLLRPERRRSGPRLHVGATFGPYPHGRSLAEALKIVRKIFPFRDKCLPAEALAKEGTPCDSTPHGSLSVNSRELTDKEMRNKCRESYKPCFNRQIGLCPGVCSGEINQREYARIIRHIKTLFSGKVKTLKRMLEKEMRAEAKAERYESAEKLRRQISALLHIRDVSLIKDESNASAIGPLNTRIEAYDVAHTSGVETVAVMVVVNNGEPEKESYRKFRIKTAKNDDIGALKEVLSRRLAHSEWPLPRIFAVDGATAHLRAAAKVLKDAGIMIPVVAVVKNEFHKPERMIGDGNAIKRFGREILLANQEAHRFAISYHRKRLQARK